VYISPYCRSALEPPNFIKFGIQGHLTDVITCVNFLVNRFRGYGVLTSRKWPFPLTCCVALTTVRTAVLHGDITGCAVAQHCYNGDISFLWEKSKIWPPVKSKPLNRLTQNLSALI